MKPCLLILTTISSSGLSTIKFSAIRKAWNHTSLINESSLLLGFSVVKYSIAWFFYSKNAFKGLDTLFCNKNSRHFVRDSGCGFARIDSCLIRRSYISDISIGTGSATSKDACNCWSSQSYGKRNASTSPSMLSERSLTDRGVSLVKHLCRQQVRSSTGSVK